MASNVVFNGVTYSIPDDADSDWGPDLTAYFISLAANTFQRSGGSFTLTAEVNFGNNYGIKLPYIKSVAANPAGAGVLRLGNTETIQWRNAANSANIALTVNASDELTYNGTKLLISGNIVNADIDAAAAIALTKLATVTASRALVSDVSGNITASAITAVELSRLSGLSADIQTSLDLLNTDNINTQTALDAHIADLVGAHAATAVSFTPAGTIAASTVQAAVEEVATDAATALSAHEADTTSVHGIADTSLLVTTTGAQALTNKTIDADSNTLSNIADAQIKAAAAIALNKLAAITASRVPVGDASGFLVASAVTATELGYVSGVTSAIQTQIGTKLTNPLTTTGDLIYSSSGTTPARLAAGTAGQVLMSAGAAAPVWSAVLPRMVVIDSKSASTDGGSSLAGVNTRALNTTQINTITGASLASNQVTLPAGTYYFEGSAPAFGVSQHKVYLWNVTDGVLAITGQAQYAAGTSNTNTSSLTGQLTIAGTKVFELRHLCAAAVATNGLGVNGGGVLNEVYGMLTITKVG